MHFLTELILNAEKIYIWCTNEKKPYGGIKLDFKFNNTNAKNKFLSTLIKTYWKKIQFQQIKCILCTARFM